MMRQQDSEETVKEIEAITSSKGTYLPLDVILEILLRLPAKAVVKFGNVSKLFSSITTVPCFIRSFTARSKSPYLVILLSLIDSDKLVVVSLLENQNSKENPLVVDSYSMTCPQGCYILCDESVNGLICVMRSGYPQIWNPTTRHFSNLPKSPSKGSLSFLGYDPIEGIYKILSIPCRHHILTRNNQARVLTLGGTQESWRDIQGIPPHMAFSCGGCIDGVLYYIASPRFDYYSHQFLVSFNVRSEKLSVIKVPWAWTWCIGFLIAYEGKLVGVCSQSDDISITMWTLEDAKKEEWSYKHVRLPFRLSNQVSQTWLELHGVNDAGEFIYVPSTLNPFQIIYFDPKANSFREVMVEGVLDDQFRGRYGLGDKPFCIYKTYTNHMESLMSF